MERIKSLGEQILSFEKQLSFKDAQHLYLKAIQTNDERLKSMYLDKVILGTLYVVLEYIKKHNLGIMQNPSCDEEDLLSFFVEAWINRINNGELLKVHSFKGILSEKFIKEVCDKFVSSSPLISHYISINKDYLSELFYLYIQLKNHGKTISLKNLYNSVTYEANCKHEYSTYYYEYLLNVFEDMYNSLYFDKTSDLKLTKNDIRNFIDLIVSNGLCEPLFQNVQAKDMETVITDEMFYENVRLRVGEILTSDLSRDIIYKRYGLDGDVPKTYDEIAEYYKIDKYRVKDLESKATKELRKKLFM